MDTARRPAGGGAQAARRARQHADPLPVATTAATPRAGPTAGSKASRPARPSRTSSAASRGPRWRTRRSAATSIQPRRRHRHAADRPLAGGHQGARRTAPAAGPPGGHHGHVRGRGRREISRRVQRPGRSSRWKAAACVPAFDEPADPARRALTGSTKATPPSASATGSSCAWAATAPWELYNLKTDRTELHDLARRPRAREGTGRQMGSLGQARPRETLSQAGQASRRQEGRRTLQDRYFAMMDHFKFGAHQFLWKSHWTDDDLPILDAARALGLTLFEMSLGDDVQFDRRACAGRRRRSASSYPSAPATSGRMSATSPPTTRVTGNVGWRGTRRLIEQAAELGAAAYCGAIYSHPGRVCRRPPPADELPRAAENLHLLADYADQLGVRVVIEPMSRFRLHLVNTAAPGGESGAAGRSRQPAHQPRHVPHDHRGARLRRGDPLRGGRAVGRSRLRE